MYLSSLIFFACGVIAIKPTKTILILASLKLNPFTWTFKFFRDQLEIILHMFWYTKSNAKHGKIKIPDFQIAVNSICEEKVYLWTNDITFWAHLFMGRPMLIFFKKKVLPSLITSIFMTKIRHWLRWLSCFPRLYIKNNP